MNTPAERTARPEDPPAMTRLLTESSLSPEGVPEFLEHFRLVRNGADLVGMAGIEHYDSNGLLRSLAFAPSHCSGGIGRLLLRQTIDGARERGIRRLVLPTATAAGYFGRHGFRIIDRRSVTGGITTPT